MPSTFLQWVGIIVKVCYAWLNLNISEFSYDIYWVEKNSETFGIVSGTLPGKTPKPAGKTAQQVQLAVSGRFGYIFQVSILNCPSRTNDLPARDITNRADRPTDVIN